MNKTTTIFHRSVLATTVALACAIGFSTTATAAQKFYGGEDATGEVVTNAGKSWGNKVEAGDYERIVGGNYTKQNSGTAEHQQSHSYKFGDIKLTIGDGVTVSEDLVAGHRHAYGFPDGGNYPSTTFETHTASTDLTINGGAFVGNYEINDADGAGSNARNDFVTAGDYFKDRGLMYHGINTSRSTIDHAKLTINGGTFDAPVYGGSIMDAYSAQGVDMKAVVTKSEVTINGGTFNHNIYAGGAAYNSWVDGGSTSLQTGKQIVSHVVSSTLYIGGDAKVKGDIYTGGLVGFTGQHETAIPTLATVGTSELVIEGVDVGNIYGTGATAMYKPGKAKPSDLWTVTANPESVTDTQLTLVNATAQNVDIKKGQVMFRAEGEEGSVRVRMLTLGEDVDFQGSTDGALNDSLGGNVTDAKDRFMVGNDKAKLDKLTMEAGGVVGQVEATFDDNGNILTQTEATNGNTLHVAEVMTATPQVINRVLSQDLRLRMGNLRSSEGKTGVWARYNGGEMAGHGIDADFTMIQVGADTALANGLPRVGFAFSYADVQAESIAKSEADHFSLAGYGVWMNENGQFIDLIGRLSKVSTDFTHVAGKGSADQFGVGLSGEFGLRFDWLHALFVEPSVVVAYNYLNSDDFAVGDVRYDLENSHSLTSRLGVASGFKLPANRGEVYARVALAHEYLGDVDVKASKATVSRTYTRDGQDTWFEYALGANVNVNANTYVYADVERTVGATFDEDWRANLGVRISF